MVTRKIKTPLADLAERGDRVGEGPPQPRPERRGLGRDVALDLPGGDRHGGERGDVGEVAEPPLHRLDLDPDPAQLALDGEDLVELPCRDVEVPEQPGLLGLLGDDPGLDVEELLPDVLRIRPEADQLTQRGDALEEPVVAVDRDADLPGGMAGVARGPGPLGVGDVRLAAGDQPRERGVELAEVLGDEVDRGVVDDFPGDGRGRRLGVCRRLRRMLPEASGSPGARGGVAAPGARTALVARGLERRKLFVIL